MSNKVKVALLGAGLRGVVYTNYALTNPDEMEVVALADPNPDRRAMFQQAHGLPDEMCFADWEQLLSQPKLADAIIICTQDKMHYEPTMRALDAGYHVLLEKPMSPDPLECVEMGEKARSTGRVFSICHVLRYTPFFDTLKRLLEEGAIGRLMSIQHNENVAYWHQAHSYVRGNWGNSDKSSPMILAKSSHDMDILHWLVGSDCIHISSFGSLSHYKAEYAPEGAPLRCLDGCPVSDTCVYYAPNYYLTGGEDWMLQALSDDQSYEARKKALEEGPYGRCVYHCDNNVVDHQVVNMEFANEVTVAFTMSAFTKHCSRTLKLMGTMGEIRGDIDKNEIEIRRFDQEQYEIIKPLLEDAYGHGGGDMRLVADFVQLVRKGGSGKGLTSAEASVQSHLMAFAAEQARLSHEVIHLPSYMKQLQSQSTAVVSAGER
ncbi:Gfo/Idh/MocA family protein [Paenibacillus marinisediminis]